jgi:phosphatidate cytidylyltransferase
LATRCVSGIIGAVFIIAILICNQSFPILLNILVAIICAISDYELFCVMGLAIPLKKSAEKGKFKDLKVYIFRKKIYILTISSLLFSILLPMASSKIFKQILWFLYTIITFGFAIFMASSAKKQKKFRHVKKTLKFQDIIVAYSITALILFSLTTLIKLRDIGGRIGSFYVLIVLGIAWFSDTGAYFGGNFLGKQKLCPEISPKKTVEGVVSGAVTCVLLMLLMGKAFESKLFGLSAQINYINFIITCFVGAFIAVIGDLCFSLLKRSYNVKDFGNILPGHGGALDRFDSVIFVAPFVYFILKNFSFLSA